MVKLKSNKTPEEKDGRGGAGWEGTVEDQLMPKSKKHFFDSHVIQEVGLGLTYPGASFIWISHLPFQKFCYLISKDSSGDG